MRNRLTCDQIMSLISFYMENHLNDRLRSYIDEHLLTCESCRNFYGAFVKTENDISVNNQNEIYPDFTTNLSAYIDNELDEKESLRIKKAVITNPLARYNLESMYSLKRNMQEAFEKTKSECKNDYSKYVLSVLNGENPDYYFRRLVYLFSAMIGFILIGFVISLNL